LAVLSEQAGSLVTKDRLMERVWTDTHVTDDSLVQCVSEIRKALGPEAGALLRTVPKQGYRLDAAPARQRRMSLRSPARIALLAAIAVVALVALLLSLRQPVASNVQSIAVLPFENLSGDPAQRYYSDGLAEELIVDLSRIADLRVVSRAASFSVARQTSDPRHVAAFHAIVQIADGRAEDELITISEAFARNPVPPFWYQMPLGVWSEKCSRAANSVRYTAGQNPGRALRFWFGRSPTRSSGRTPFMIRSEVSRCSEVPCKPPRPPCASR
jgi:hypothetical protein